MKGPCPGGYHIPTYNEHVSLKNIMQTLGIPYSTDYELYLHMPFKWWMRKYGNGSVDYTTQSSYWSCSKSSNAWYAWYLTGSTGGTTSGVTTSNNGYGRRANWNHIRPFRDTPITLDSPNVVSFAQTYSWTGDAWVYEFTLTSWEIVVSITADWVSWITIANKNLWATTMYISWDTASEANCWKFYQWGNNYWFPFTWSITTSSTRVDASSYWPWNYYSSSTFITNSTNPADWSSVQNDNLRWWETGVKHMSDLKNAYIGEYIPTSWLLGYRPLQSDLKDYSWNGNDWSWYSGTGSFGTIWGKTWAVVTKISHVGYDDHDTTTQHIVTTLNYSWPTVTICWWVYYNSMNSWLWNGILTNTSSNTNFISLSPRPAQSNKWTVWGANNLLTTNTSASAWTWYFVCWVLTSSWKKVYLNWSLIGSDNTWFTTWQWSIWRLGCWQINSWTNMATAWWTDGYIRHCAVYNRELTADEILKYYNLTA